MSFMQKAVRAGAVLLAAAAALVFVTPRAGHSQGPATDVVVVNTNEDPVQVQDVDIPARQAFHKRLVVTVPARSVGAVRRFEVPDDQHLAIEYVSLDQAADTDLLPSIRMPEPVVVRLVTEVQDEPALWVLPTLVDRASFLRAGVGEVRIYADPGSEVLLNVTRTSLNRSAPLPTSVGISLSGHLVDELPSG